MLDFNLLRGAAVQITREGQPLGSGWIAPSEKSGVFYCLTARHCVEKAGFTLLLETADGGREVLPYTEVVMRDKDGPDAAVLCVNYPTDQYPEQLYIGHPNHDHNQAIIIGYPKIRGGERLCCRVEINYTGLTAERTIRVNMVDASTGKTDLYQQVEGISGGGCIVEDGSGEYKLVAIETGFADRSDSLCELSCVGLDAFNDLLLAHNMDPLAPPRYRYASQLWERGQNVLRKQKEYRDYDKWVDTKASADVIQGLHEQFQGPRRPDRSMLLCGFSGVGKTRTVLQAFVGGEELSNAIFFDSFDDFDQVFNSGLKSYAATAPDERIYLIVDDVDLDKWQELDRTIRPYTNVHALAIAEMGEELKNRQDLPILWLSSCDEEDTIKVILAVHPTLTGEDAHTIFQLSRNDLRFALLIAYMAEKAPDLLKWEDNFASDTYSARKLVEKLMSQFRSESERKAVKIFSLFVDFGCAGRGTQELEFLGSYFDMDITLLRRTMNACLRHQLGISKRGICFELSPRAFALLLFAENRTELIRDRKMSEFMDNIPTDVMRRKFLRRAQECGENVWKEVQGALSPWFRGKYGDARWTISQGILGAECSELTLGDGRTFSPAEVMDYVEFVPEDGLPWMLGVINNAPDEMLDRFPGYGSGRRELVWACEHLSCFQEHFGLCEQILFRLALHETEGAITNNSRGIWSQLFGLMLSNAENPFQERFGLLLRRMRSYQDSWDAKPFQMALGCALSWSGTRILPPKLIGGRLMPESWSSVNITNMGELIDIHGWMLLELDKAFKSLPLAMGQVVFDCLKSHMNDYVGGWIGAHAPKLRMQYCQVLQRYGEEADRKLAVVIEINEVIRRQTLLCKGSSEKAIYEAQIAFLEQWRSHFVDENYIPRLKVLLAGGVMARQEEFQARAEKLAGELLSFSNAPEVLRDVVSQCNVKEYSFYFFANVVGKVDVNGKLLPAACELFSQGSSQFPESYFSGVYSRSGTAPEPLLSLLDEATDRNPLGVLRMSVMCDFSQPGFARICGLLRQGVTDNCIRAMAYQQWTEYLTAQQMEDFLSVLIGSGTNENACYFFSIGQAWVKCVREDGFPAFLLECAVKTPVQARQQYSYEFIHMMEAMPQEFLKDCLSLTVQSIDYSHIHTLYSEHIDYLQKHAKGEYAKEIAFEVCDCIAEYSQGPIWGKSLAVLVRLLRGEDVLQWIGADKENRAKLIAYHLPAPATSAVYVPEVTEKVLEHYCGDDIFHQFWIGTHAYCAYSYDEVEEQSGHTFEVLEQYAEYPLEAIRLWADYEKQRIESIIDEKRKMDAETDRLE